MRAKLKSTLVAAAWCSALAVVGSDAARAQDPTGVWYGTYRITPSELSTSAGRDLSQLSGSATSLIFYRLELDANGRDITGTMVVGRGVDTRTSREKAMAALGVPAKAPPAPPSVAYKIVGIVDGQTLALEGRMPMVQLRTIDARVKGDRMRAEVNNGQTIHHVTLERCTPPPDDADACSTEALWTAYLEQSHRFRRQPQMPGLSNLPANSYEAPQIWKD